MPPTLAETCAKVPEKRFDRLTKDGRKITYALKVLQQPTQARACGAGAKSSADRRPVDPPPVVQLNIIESELDGSNPRDITIHHDAGFFLFTTLEWARPMAHGRVQGQPICPVLTGVAVAGVAYLDRPAAAGYFIFPDLSVRHEGLYRLSFNLYEDVKQPADEEKETHESARPRVPGRKLRGPQKFLRHRGQVQSNDFTVFSAKKFPGLSESTELSRCVAEQGCRVRIRRDVRLRRREPKPGDKYYSRHATPATPIERSRSASNASIDHPHGYGATPQHPSIREMGYPPQPYHVSPMQPLPGQSHLAFGMPAQHYSHQPPHQRPPYQSPHPGYSHSRQVSGGGPEYAPQQPPYAAPRLPTAEGPEDCKPVLPPLDKAYLQIASDGRRPSNGTSSQKLAMSPPPTFKSPSVPASRPMPQIHPGSIDHGPSAQYTAHYGPTRPEGPAKYDVRAPQAMKRSHCDTFPSHDEPQRLCNGKRPHESEDKSAADEVGGDTAMTYSRADGRVGIRYRNA